MVESMMLRRGLIPGKAPPPDIEFLRGYTPPIPELNNNNYDHAPELVAAAPPQYPEMAKEAQVEGTVVLRVFVGRDGRVHDVRVMRPVNYLDGAAKAAVSKWIYKPALLHGEPIAAWIDVPVEFRLP